MTGHSRNGAGLLGAKPIFRDRFRGTQHSLIPNLRGGAVTVGSGANVQVCGLFVNGPTRAFDFIDHDGSGGDNARVLLGGSEVGWGAWVKQLGNKGVTFVVYFASCSDTNVVMRSLALLRHWTSFTISRTGPQSAVTRVIVNFRRSWE